MLKLNIGCGLKYKKNYINIDSEDNTISDEVMLPYELTYDDESVDLIESFQLIENLGFSNTVLSFGEWFRVLKSNSSLFLETSDIEKTFEIYLKNTDHKEKATTLNWLYDLYDRKHTHKYCYPAGLLRKLLVESGFVEIMENHHEKTFGAPTYTLIAKKPLTYNANYILIHKIRKRLYNEIEIFTNDKSSQYRFDFEKTVLNYSIDFTPRDFSMLTFNELFTNCLAYSIKAAKILIEESSKLDIISIKQYQRLLERLNYLESLSFTKNLYSIWQNNFQSYNNPDKAYLLTLDYAKNIAKQALFDTSLEDFKLFFNETISSKTSKEIVSEQIFSYQLIENKLSQILAKYIKGIATKEEISLCKALMISS